MRLSFPLTKMGNYPRSLKVLMQASAIAEDRNSSANTNHQRVFPSRLRKLSSG